MPIFVEFLEFDGLTLEMMREDMGRARRTGRANWREAQTRQTEPVKVDLSLVNANGKSWEPLIRTVNRASGRLVVLVGEDAPAIGLTVLKSDFQWDALERILLDQLGDVDARKEAFDEGPSTLPESMGEPVTPKESPFAWLPLQRAHQKKTLRVLACNFSEGPLRLLHQAVVSGGGTMVEATWSSLYATVAENSHLVIMVSVESVAEAERQKERLRSVVALVERSKAAQRPLFIAVCSVAVRNLLKESLKNRPVTTLVAPIVAQDMSDILDLVLSSKGVLAPKGQRVLPTTILMD